MEEPRSLSVAHASAHAPDSSDATVQAGGQGGGFAAASARRTADGYPGARVVILFVISHDENYHYPSHGFPG